MLLVVAADGAAAAEGILPGLSLADARALRPDLAVFPADRAGDAAALARLADWCSRYTPLVAIDGADGLWLDITGCAHLFGGERALMSDLRHRLAGFGHDARAAVADSPGAAWAAARFREAEQTLLEPGTARSALAPLPVAALRLPAVMVAELERLGLRHIGDLYPLPRASLARRFGMLPGERLDQALGRIDEPISPRLPAPAFAVRQVLAEPILHLEGMAAVLAAPASPALPRAGGRRAGRAAPGALLLSRRRQAGEARGRHQPAEPRRCRLGAALRREAGAHRSRLRHRGDGAGRPACRAAGRSAAGARPQPRRRRAGGRSGAPHRSPRQPPGLRPPRPGRAAGEPFPRTRGEAHAGGLPRHGREARRRLAERQPARCACCRGPSR